MLSKAELQHELGVSVIGRKLFVFEEIDSTNLCAKVMADAGTEEGAVVIADHQTAGRGRRGRTWVAARGDNLLFSIILRPALSTDDLARLTFLVATAVARTVHATCNLTAECKWPNDVLIDGKKVCGILVENGVANGIAQYSVVGVGLNVNQSQFPEDLHQQATSLSIASGKPWNRIHVMQSLLRSLDSAYAHAQATLWENVLPDWTAQTKMFNRPVSIATHDGIVTGTALRLAPDGGLVIASERGEQTFHAGDVSLLI